MVDKDIFELAINFVFNAEGYLSNDKDDPGGLTKYGISKKAYPDLDIKNLTIDQAKEIYYNDYWKKIKCDRISFINPKLAICVFDTHVNTGNGIRILQQTIKQYNEDKFRKIKVDNIYGQQTEELLKELNHIAPNYILYNYLLNREFYYSYICTKNRKLLKFRIGWSNRVRKLRDYITNLSFDSIS